MMTRWHASRKLLTAMLLAFAACGAAPIVPVSGQTVASSTTDDVTLVSGLMQRRLFELARFHCEQVLSDPNRSTREKIDVAIADIQTRSQQAFQAADALREPLWLDAEQTARDHAERFADSPRQILIRVQQSLVLQAKVEQLRQEIEADMAAGDARSKAQSWIRLAIRGFEDSLEEIRVLLNQRPRTGGDNLTALELLALRNNINYQIARCHLHRALLYSDRQELDRNEALQQVNDALDSVLNATSPGQPLWWQAQADRLAVARHSGRFEVNQSVLNQLRSEVSDGQQRSRLISELIRLLIAQGDLARASQLADNSPTASRWPELDLARIELLTALSVDSQQSKQQRSGWRNYALQLAGQIEEVHGSYWARRANLLIVDSAGDSVALSGNVDMLVVLATEAQRKQKWEEAVKALDTARQLAANQNLADLAYKLGFRAAAIRQQQQDFEDAAQRFESVATQFSRLTDAPSAHLMACWNMAKTVGQDHDRLAKYRSMLEFNIATWPQSAAADQTRIWLAQLWQNQRNWPAAIEQLLGVSLNSSLVTQAIRQLSSCVDAYVAELKSQNVSADNLIQTVVDRYAPALRNADRFSPEQWTESICEMVLLLANLHFRYQADLDLDIRSLVDTTYQRSQSANYGCSDRALAWAFVAVSPDLEAASVGDELSELAASESAIDILLHGLTSRAQFDPEQFHGKFSELLAAVYQLRVAGHEGLSPARLKAWRLALLDAYVRDEQFSAAIEHSEQLVQQYPRDLELKIRHAQLQTRAAQVGATPGSMAAALSSWRKIANQLRPYTPAWFQSKYHVALLLESQGKRDEALQLLKYIQAVPPGWDQSEWADEFAALLAKCQQ